MNVNFLFMDESFSETMRVSSLTGIVVPVEHYPRVRTEFYRLLPWAIEPAPNTIASAPELHGSDFLRSETDERKLEVFGGVVDLALAHALRVYRIGYFITDAIEQSLLHDRRLIGTCWFSLRSMMEPLLEREAVIPVMDGFNQNLVDQFSAPVKFTDEISSIDKETWLGSRHTRNILGEVFYADSKYSVMIQIADLVSYLRNASDLAKFGFPMSRFKASLAGLSRRLEACIAWEAIISLILNGKIQGPEKAASPPFKGSGPITRAPDVVPSDAEDLKPPSDPCT